MRLLRRLYARLGLTVNETKTKVASVLGRKFLGYSFWVARANTGRWWRNSGRLLHRVLNLRCADELGIPHLS